MTKETQFLFCLLIAWVVPFSLHSVILFYIKCGSFLVLLKDCSPISKNILII